MYFIHTNTYYYYYHKRKKREDGRTKYVQKMRQHITTTINESLLKELKKAEIKTSEALQYGAKIMLGKDYHATKSEIELQKKIEKLAGRLTEITNRIYDIELKNRDIKTNGDA